MDELEMPNAAEIIERLARECERQRIEIAALRERLKALEEKKAQEPDPVETVRQDR